MSENQRKTHLKKFAGRFVIDFYLCFGLDSSMCRSRDRRRGA
jgi:hypothetical protein